MDTDMEVSTRLECAGNPAQCPQCGHGPLADIIYGFPIIDDDLIKRWNEESIVIGGYIITGDESRWACTKCG
jgi:ribosomal protein S27AE